MDRGQISLQQLNEAIEKMGAFCAANSLPHLSEDQLRNDLGLGTMHKSTFLFFIDANIRLTSPSSTSSTSSSSGSKCKAAILFLLQLKRISSQFHSGASVYVPTPN